MQAGNPDSVKTAPVPICPRPPPRPLQRNTAPARPHDPHDLPAPSLQVTVTSSSRKLMAKIQRKEQRKGQKSGRGAVDEDMELLQVCVCGGGGEERGGGLMDLAEALPMSITTTLTQNILRPVTGSHRGPLLCVPTPPFAPPLLRAWGSRRSLRLRRTRAPPWCWATAWSSRSGARARGWPRGGCCPRARRAGGEGEEGEGVRWGGGVVVGGPQGS